MVTLEDLENNNFKNEHIDELLNEGFIIEDEVEVSNLDELRGEILEKGLVGRLNTKDGLIEKLSVIKDEYINRQYPDMPAHIAVLIINITESNIFSKIEELEEWFLTKED